MSEYRRPTITKLSQHPENFNQPTIEKKESTRNEKLIQACKELELKAEEILRETYPKSEYAFHNIEHSKEVADKVEEILRVIQSIDPKLVSDEDIAFARAEAMFHDIPQDREQFGDTDYDPITYSIKRRRGFNEELINPHDRTSESFIGNEQKAAIQFIELIRTGPNAELFKDFTDEEIHLEFGSTYPDLDFRPLDNAPEHLQGLSIFTMTQPIAPKASIRGLALALSDLKEAGGNVTNKELPHKKALKAGNDEFRELYKGFTVQIQMAIRNQQTFEEAIIPPTRKNMLKTMLGWKRGQEEFYLGQERDLHTILENSVAIQESPKAEEIRQALRERYNGFEIITSGLRQEYLTLVDELDLKTENGSPLLDTILQLDTIAMKLKNEASLLGEDNQQINALEAEAETIRQQSNHLKATYEEKLASVSPRNFYRVLNAMGY